MILKWVGRIRLTGKLPDLESESRIFPRGRASQGDDTVCGKSLRQGEPGVLEAIVV